MPLSLQEFGRQARQKFLALRDLSDEAAAERVIQKYPELRQVIVDPLDFLGALEERPEQPELPPGRSPIPERTPDLPFGLPLLPQDDREPPPPPPGPLLPTAIRAGAPVIGTLAGTIIGSRFGYPLQGARIGGSVLGAGGDVLATLLEKGEYGVGDLPATAFEAGIGGIFPRALPVGIGKGAAALKRGIQGATLGGTTVTGESLVREGEAPTIPEFLLGTLGGATLGAGGGLVERAFDARSLQKAHAATAQQAKEVAEATAFRQSLLDAAQAAPEPLVPKQLVAPRRFFGDPEGVITDVDAPLALPLPPEFLGLPVARDPRFVQTAEGFVDLAGAKELPELLATPDLARPSLGAVKQRIESQRIPSDVLPSPIRGAEPIPSTIPPQTRLSTEPFVTRKVGEEGGRLEVRPALQLAGGIAGALGGGTIGETPEERIKNALVMGAFGVAAPVIFSRPRGAQLPPLGVLGENVLESLGGKAAKELSTAVDTPGLRSKEALQNKFIYIEKRVREIAKQTKPLLRDEQDPSFWATNAGHRVGGRITLAEDEMTKIVNEAENEGLLPRTHELLGILGSEHSLDALQQKAADLLQQGSVDEAMTYLARIAAGEVEKPATKAFEKGAGIFARVYGGKALPGGLTPEKLQAALKEFGVAVGPEQFERISSHVSKIIAFNRETWQKAYSGDLLRDEVFAKLAVNPKDPTQLANYAPMIRVIDAVNQASVGKLVLSLPGSKALLQRLGSPRVVKDMIAGSVVRRALVETEIERNAAAKAAAQLYEEFPKAYGRLLRPRVPGEHVSPEDGIIAFLDKGQKREYVAEKRFADVLKLVNAPQLDVMGSAILRMANRPLQLGATTLNLAWATVINPPKDAFDTAFMSRLVRNPAELARFAEIWAETLGETIAGAAKENPLWREFAESGALWAGFQRNLTPELFTDIGGSYVPLTKRTIGEVVTRGVKQAVAPMAHTSAAFETATKFAGYKLLRERAGPGALSKTQQAKIALEVADWVGSPNYGKTGTLGPQLGALIIFYNATVQGIDRNFRMFTQRPERVMGGLLAVTGLEFARRGWNSKFIDDDGTPSTDMVSNTDKENNFIWMTAIKRKAPDGVMRYKALKIAKPHFVRILSNPVEAVFDVLEGKANARKAAFEAAVDVGSQFLPFAANLDPENLGGSAVRGVASSLSPALRIPGELLSGTRTFTNTPIDSEADRLSKLPFSRRSARSPALQGLVRGAVSLGAPDIISPNQLQHIIESGASSLGEIPIDIADYVVSGEDPLRVAGPLSRRVFATTFDQPRASQQQALFQLNDRATSVYNTVRQMIEEKDIAGAQELAIQNADLLDARLEIGRTVRKVQELLKARDEFPDAELVLREFLEGKRPLLERFGVAPE